MCLCALVLRCQGYGQGRKGGAHEARRAEEEGGGRTTQVGSSSASKVPCTAGAWQPVVWLQLY